MPKTSAGILLFRRTHTGLQVLLGHMGGPYWQNKDAGAWTIPKGEFDPEVEDAWAAAKREFAEETGLVPQGKCLPLGYVKQRSGKVLHAWALEGDFDPADLTSNTFQVEWPPRTGQLQRFPELDRAAWFDVEVAKGKVIEGQEKLLARLKESRDGRAL